MIATMLEVVVKVTNSHLVVPDLVEVALTTTVTEAHQAVQEDGVEAELTVASSSLLGVMAPVALQRLLLMELQQNVSLGLLSHAERRYPSFQPAVTELPCCKQLTDCVLLAACCCVLKLLAKSIMIYG